MRGRTKDLENAWSELDLQGLDFLALQELGGHPNLAQPWQILEANLDGCWGFYASNLA